MKKTINSKILKIVGMLLFSCFAKASDFIYVSSNEETPSVT